MSLDNLKLLLAPRSMAIIGASSDPKRMSGMIVHQARRFGFTGDIYPINPRHETLAGFPCYGSVLELKDTPPDLAVIYLKAEAAVAAARDCAAIGVRALVVLSAGFSELGERGKKLQAELTQVCRDAGIEACGPNTAGLANFNAGFVSYGASGFSGMAEQAGGNVAIVSSSGGLGTTLMSYCHQRGLGVSHLIGIGNEAVTTAADYLDALVDDPDVATVVMLLESIRDRDRFFAAADKALAAGKQVIVMKQGRTDVGMRSIQTHTAAMGGSAVDFEAACRAHGIVVVRELRALADQALMAVNLGEASGWDVGVLSLPGGGTSLLGDAAAEAGFRLPSLSESTAEALRPLLPEIAAVGNPLDPTAGFGRDNDRLRQSIELFAADPAFDVIFFFQSQSEAAYCADIARALVAARPGMTKPLVVVWEAGRGLEDGAWEILHGAGIPLYPSAQDAFAALARTRAFSTFRRSPAVDPRGKSDARPVLSDTTPEALFDWIGVPRPASDVATSAQEAVAIASRIGYPVVMKVESRTVVHKSDVGGVRLGVPDDDAARDAYDTIVDAVRSAAGEAAVDGVLVQETAPKGVEVLVGIHTDEQVGPLVTLGFGGVLTELLADVTRRPAPLSRQDVREMLDEVKVGSLLRGYRGSPPAHVEALVDLVERIGWAAHELRDQAPELELNPVIVGPEGTKILAVDWVVR